MMIQNRESIIINVVDGQIQDFFNQYFDNLSWSVRGGGYVAEISINEDSQSLVIDLIPVDIDNTMKASTVGGELSSDRAAISMSSDRETVG